MKKKTPFVHAGRRGFVTKITISPMWRCITSHDRFRAKSRDFFHAIYAHEQSDVRTNAWCIIRAECLTFSTQKSNITPDINITMSGPEWAWIRVTRHTYTRRNLFQTHSMTSRTRRKSSLRSECATKVSDRIQAHIEYNAGTKCTTAYYARAGRASCIVTRESAKRNGAGARGYEGLYDVIIICNNAPLYDFAWLVRILTCPLL